ncbi:MAG: Holliday junction resolvase RuvX [Candidatus Alcyoniella australis]|nr:Holliday junction resolvase RuvX [Candidatus Alcyoniella australis]
MAVDYGDKRIGLAVSDPSEQIALPSDTLTNPGTLEAAAELVAHEAQGRSVELIVLGLPLNMDGSEGERAVLTRKFAALLEGHDLRVDFADERLTSWEAERMMIEADVSRKRRKQASDKLAATLILRQYLQWRAKS